MIRLNDLDRPTAPSPVRARPASLLKDLRVLTSRRPPRHRRGACSTAWRCRFVPDTLVDFHTAGDRRRRGVGELLRERRAVIQVLDNVAWPMVRFRARARVAATQAASARHHPSRAAASSQTIWKPPVALPGDAHVYDSIASVMNRDVAVPQRDGAAGLDVALSVVPP